MPPANQRVRKAVIPVAGLGTRGLPFTKEVPKELLPVIDKPGIHYIVEEVIAAGIDQVIFVTSKGKASLEDYFDPSPNLESWLRKRGKEELADRIRDIGRLCEVISVRQKEPLGLGHAIRCARPVVGDEMFAVCLGDEIFPAWGKDAAAPALKTLVEHAVGLKASVAGVMEVTAEETSSYGIVDVGGSSLGTKPAAVKGTVEKPSPDKAPSRYAIIGRYVFEPRVFEELERIQPGKGGEYQLTDAMDRLCKEGRLYASLVQSRRYDIGSHFSFVRAQIDCALERPELADKVRAYLKTLNL